jgi:hypothetical protein
MKLMLKLHHLNELKGGVHKNIPTLALLNGF